MLSKEINELLTRVGPGTPMGRVLREYWTPAVRSARLIADGAPQRVRLMGENYVAFRATDGRVGFLNEACPHRCASLALARNEDNALRCIFHGWKIDVTGKVVDVPSEPAARRAEFAASVPVRHYPVREAGGIVWAYLGGQKQPPRFFNFEFTSLPTGQVNPTVAILRANWLQGFEAAIDSAHAGILHSAWFKPADEESKRRYGSSAYAVLDTGPTFEFLPTKYGFREGALRDLGDSCYARIREVVLPYYSLIPFDSGEPCLLVAAVPIDDEWTAQWYISYDPELSSNTSKGAYSNGTIEGSSGNPDNFCSDMGDVNNLWHQDRTLMKTGHFTGIARCIPYEDFVVQESMGAIVDRSREWLGLSDAPIIRGRRLLLQAVRDFESGKPLPGLEDDIDYSKLRGLATIYKKGGDWRDIDVTDPPVTATCSISAATS